MVQIHAVLETILLFTLVCFSIYGFGYMVRTHIKEYRENCKENHHRAGGNKGRLK